MSLPSQKELQEQLEKLSENLNSASHKGSKIKTLLNEKNTELSENKSFIKAEIHILKLQLAKVKEEIQKREGTKKA